MGQNCLNLSSWSHLCVYSISVHTLAGKGLVWMLFYFFISALNSSILARGVDSENGFSHLLNLSQIRIRLLEIFLASGRIKAGCSLILVSNLSTQGQNARTRLCETSRFDGYLIHFKLSMDYWYWSPPSVSSPIRLCRSEGVSITRHWQ